MPSPALPQTQASAPVAQRLEAEQLRRVASQTPAALAILALYGPAGLSIYWSYVSQPLAWIVLGFVYATLCCLLIFYLRYRRANLSTPMVRKAYARGSVWWWGLHGVCWGVWSLVIFTPESMAYQSLAGVAMYAICVGAIVVVGPHYPSFIVFTVPTLAPILVRSFWEGTPESIGLASGGTVGLLFVLVVGHIANRESTAAILTGFENVDLVQALQQQKAAAEQARAEAEAANREKSRFLAAASHDLRQPVHALGLYVSVAQHPASEAERHRILACIEASVDSLATLFDSLLDVSRLDAGTLQPRLRTVALKPLLQKLAAEYSPLAHEKHLSFRVRAAELSVRTDPLLFEQMIRNLVANAVRYTERGGILLTCRRRGAHARVQVWDTGVGIAAQEQAQVFEEFYQIGNPERDRRKGVGLGLAIVKRIATLLQHPLQLASRQGRGSCFSVEAPLAGAESADASEPQAAVDDDDSVLLGAVIVVVDDETDILLAAEMLLKQWGCIVITADALAPALDKLSVEDRVPDLAVSDYRLRGEESGIEVIGKLRARFGSHTPALLLTGDTAAERLREVAASGLQVLHKPLNAAQLKRALIRALR